MQINIYILCKNITKDSINLTPRGPHHLDVIFSWFKIRVLVIMGYRTLRFCKPGGGPTAWEWVKNLKLDPRVAWISLLVSDVTKLERLGKRQRGEIWLKLEKDLDLQFPFGTELWHSLFILISLLGLINPIFPASSNNHYTFLSFFKFQLSWEQYNYLIIFFQKHF